MQEKKRKKRKPARGLFDGSNLCIDGMPMCGTQSRVYKTEAHASEILGIKFLSCVWDTPPEGGRIVLFFSASSQTLGCRNEDPGPASCFFAARRTDLNLSDVNSLQRILKKFSVFDEQRKSVARGLVLPDPFSQILGFQKRLPKHRRFDPGCGACRRDRERRANRLIV